MVPCDAPCDALLQALPPPSLIDPVTAKAALALASANEASDAAMDGTAAGMAASRRIFDEAITRWT